MGVFNVMFPVLSGKEDACRAWIAELSGARKEGFDELQRRSEIERETLTLVSTPMGSFLLVWFDGDVEKAFAAVIGGQDEFTKWHRAQLLDVTGLDLSVPDEGPPPELLLDWRAA
jgi:hypothetical protein